MFVPLPLLILAGVVFGALLVLAFRPRGQRDDLMSAPRPQMSQPHRVMTAAAPAPAGISTVPSGTLPPEIEEQVIALLQQDQLIMAIKLVREATGLGLREAKDLAENMRRSVVGQ